MSRFLIFLFIPSDLESWTIVNNSNSLSHKEAANQIAILYHALCS